MRKISSRSTPLPACEAEATPRAIAPCPNFRSEDRARCVGSRDVHAICRACVVRRSGHRVRYLHDAYAVTRDETLPEWLRDGMREELVWFGRRLDVPGQLTRTFRRRGTIHGVCWFRPEACEHITRARHMGWLMGEAGRPVEEIRTRHPGEVIWRDAAQVVPAPGWLPRGFR